MPGPSSAADPRLRCWSGTIIFPASTRFTTKRKKRSAIFIGMRARWRECSHETRFEPERDESRRLAARDGRRGDDAADVGGSDARDGSRGARAEDVPAVRAVVGAKRFEELSVAYLTAHPSRSFSLRNLGSKLVEWLIAN